MLHMSKPCCSWTYLRCSRGRWSREGHRRQQWGCWHTCSSLCSMATRSTLIAQSGELEDQLGLEQQLNSKKYDRNTVAAGMAHCVTVVLSRVQLLLEP